MSRPDWFPAWDGETIIIVASGPSAADVPIREARGKARFIAVNTSWMLCPWADILFAGDFKWWRACDGCPEFRGLKVSIDRRACERWGEIKRLYCPRVDDRMVFDQPGTVGWGGNSGFNALNLAAQLKPAKIILVGFDMTVRHGAHWHAPNASLREPSRFSTPRWRGATDAAAKALAARGIQVINCSPVSTLTKYPKMNFAEAMAA